VRLVCVFALHTAAYRGEGFRAKASECSDTPPFADGVIGLLLGIGGLTADGLNSAFAECGEFPNNRNCHPNLLYYVPALAAAASMTYGIAAYAVCEKQAANVNSPDQQGAPRRLDAGSHDAQPAP
jgi:hypothetical protein